MQIGTGIMSYEQDSLVLPGGKSGGLNGKREAGKISGRGYWGRAIKCNMDGWRSWQRSGFLIRGSQVRILCRPPSAFADLLSLPFCMMGHDGCVAALPPETVQVKILRT